LGFLVLVHPDLYELDLLLGGHQGPSKKSECKFNNKKYDMAYSCNDKYSCGERGWVWLWLKNKRLKILLKDNNLSAPFEEIIKLTAILISWCPSPLNVGFQLALFVAFEEKSAAFNGDNLATLFILIENALQLAMALAITKKERDISVDNRRSMIKLLIYLPFISTEKCSSQCYRTVPQN
jgi:hypothetical protein